MKNARNGRKQKGLTVSPINPNDCEKILYIAGVRTPFAWGSTRQFTTEARF
jgi:hypothetical protein